MGDFLTNLNQFFQLNFIIRPLFLIIRIFDFVINSFRFNRNKISHDQSYSTIVLTSQATSVYRSTLARDLLKVDDENANLYDLFSKAVKEHMKKRALGARVVNSVFDETQANGKVFKKYSMGEYKWLTYEQMLGRVKNISNGLLKLGLISDHNIVLFAETRPEWLITAFACFRIKVSVVTLYATLDVDALPFGINQTHAEFLITTAEQLAKLKKVLDKIKSITNIIVVTDEHNADVLVDFRKYTASNINLNVYSLEQVEDIGANSSVITSFESPKKSDLAVIMYTSGSTGDPKGVMMSHGNLIVSTKGIGKRIKYNLDDLYISYLPLAHTFELTGELVCLFDGISIGYSSPQTITDTSTGIVKGQKGDLRVLKPTIMVGVPLILERLNKAVNEKIESSSWFAKTLFKKAFEYKLNKLNHGYYTKLLDKILFNKIQKKVLGGRVRLIVAGGSILSKHVQEFTRVCFAPTIQGYGLTETCSNGTTQFPHEVETENVGSPVQSCEIMLVNWDEGGYKTSDKPNPRGEILIGGENITMGYYEMPEKTSEDYIKINGTRYFATGDIGEMQPNGNLKIIDRKKDLVKLSTGEYISLNKIESIIKLLPIVDNVCVIANSLKPHCVALVCANSYQLVTFFKQELSSSADLSFLEEKNSDKLMSNMCDKLEKNESLVAKLSKKIIDYCSSKGVDRFEIPAKYKFVKEAWLPETGLVTDSLKLKRKEIEKFYSNDINCIYR